MTRTYPRAVFVLAFAFVFALPNAGAPPQQPSATAPNAGLAPIRQYITSGWDKLTRSMDRCETVLNSGLIASPVLYLPADFAEPAAVKSLEAQCKFRVMHLPVPIHEAGSVDTSKIDPPGLLYLERPYVVPGGRFNEMYGWDSYFIIRGLVLDNRVELARGMVENFFFELDHYGAILNANHTFSLTRSQPPFLTSMILEVYDAEKKAGHEDRAWLEKSYGYALKDYEMWTRSPHLVAATGLSRYFDFGDVPAAEESDSYYRGVAAYFFLHPAEDDGYIMSTMQMGHMARAPRFGRTYAMDVCDATGDTDPARCTPGETFTLSGDYYKGDRTMRESGFDISFRFGPYGAATQKYIPVCLNSLLYKTETDLEHISRELGHADEASNWRARAENRKKRMQEYLWDGKRGLFFDYNFDKQQRSTYAYITTLYPLWAGLATPEQARAIVQNVRLFKQPGGLVMSTQESGGQWDFPYEWAPMQLLSDEGLRRYGFKDDADGESFAFLSTVAENFRRDGTIREKYNGVTRSTEVHVTIGYDANVVGFGWTNGVFLALLNELPAEFVERLAKEQDAPLPPAVTPAAAPATMK
jgi:alpha,alpha-trehalase